MRARILIGALAAGLAASLSGCAPYAGYGYGYGVAAPIYGDAWSGGYLPGGAYYGGGSYPGYYWRGAYYPYHRGGYWRGGGYYRGGGVYRGGYRAGGVHGGYRRF